MQANGLVTEVYVDVLLSVNFMMDFFILWAVAKLTQVKVKKKRLVCGAIAGAVYCLAVFLPETTAVLSFAGKTVCSVLMLLVAFAPLSWKNFFRTLGYLYLVSFAMGGAVFAAVYLFKDLPGYIRVYNGAALLPGEFDFTLLAAALFVAIWIGYGCARYLKKEWAQRNLLYVLEIGILDSRVETQALLDTGNQLVEPFTGKPVIVTEIGLFKKILPVDVIAEQLGGDDVNLQGIAAQLGEKWSSRLRLIPFNSVGREHGLMIGIRPDYIEFKNEKERLKNTEVIIGLVNRTLSREGKYHALLHPELVRQVS